MKKVIALLTAALLVFGLTACGQKEAPETKAPTPETEAKTTQAAEDGTAQGTEAQTAEAGKTEEGVRTSLTVGFDAEFPPYGYMDDNGDYVGFDLDLAAEVCKRQGWELVKQPIDWNSKDMELSSGAIDCIWNGFTMNGREDQYTFSDPYIDNSQVFVVAADSGIASWDDLAGKEVLVQADSSALHALTVSAEDTDDAELVAQMESLVSSFGNMT